MTRAMWRVSLSDQAVFAAKGPVAVRAVSPCRPAVLPLTYFPCHVSPRQEGTSTQARPGEDLIEVRHVTRRSNIAVNSNSNSSSSNLATFQLDIGSQGLSTFSLDAVRLLHGIVVLGPCALNPPRLQTP